MPLLPASHDNAPGSTPRSRPPCAPSAPLWEAQPLGIHTRGELELRLATPSTDRDGYCGSLLSLRFKPHFCPVFPTGTNAGAGRRTPARGLCSGFRSVILDQGVCCLKPNFCAVDGIDSIVAMGKGMYSAVGGRWSFEDDDDEDPRAVENPEKRKRVGRDEGRKKQVGEMKARKLFRALCQRSPKWAVRVQQQAENSGNLSAPMGHLQQVVAEKLRRVVSWKWRWSESEGEGETPSTSWRKRDIENVEVPP
ncbi:hypothetical protein KM043_014284 [Ampulex compressa]|nr:hypothetical protein KM043_014284 [Ampulex compressa]